MGKIIAIANQKGGVGKTTTSVNLTASLEVSGKRVLLIDLDPQGNATMGSGVQKNALTQSITDLFLQEVAVGDLIIETPAKYHLLPANTNLTAAEINLLKLEQREYFLQKALLQIVDNYDYIIIDCPPSLNILTVNALVAASSVIVPIQCEYYALEGLAGLLETIDSIRQSVNADLKIEGILRTMYDARNRLTIEVSEQLLQHFNDKVFKTVIPRNVRLAEAPSHGLPVFMYDKTSLGAMAYLKLANELIGEISGSEANRDFISTTKSIFKKIY